MKLPRNKIHFITLFISGGGVMLWYKSCVLSTACKVPSPRHMNRRCWLLFCFRCAPLHYIRYPDRIHPTGHDRIWRSSTAGWRCCCFTSLHCIIVFSEVHWWQESRKSRERGRELCHCFCRLWVESSFTYFAQPPPVFFVTSKPVAANSREDSVAFWRYPRWRF